MKILGQILHSCFSWAVPLATEEELAGADVILAHECGDQKTISRTTRAIAENARKLHFRYEKPVIAQFPGNSAIADVPAIVISKHLRMPRAYLDTDEVQRQAAVICGLHGWKKVILCTNWVHIWRAGQNLIHHGLIPVYADNSNVHFDWRCSRWILKSAIFVAPREVLAKMLYSHKGLI